MVAKVALTASVTIKKKIQTGKFVMSGLKMNTLLAFQLVTKPTIHACLNAIGFLKNQWSSARVR